MAAASLNSVVSAIQAKFQVAQKTEFRGETTLTVERTEIKDLCAFCKDTLGFAMLLDLSGVDNFGTEPRFEVVYELYHLDTDAHLRLKIAVSEDALEVPSVITIWPTADWHEREAFDMYGVRFEGHPQLKRIYLYEQFEGHPLRKDYPTEKRQPLIGPGAVHRDPMNDDLTR